MSVVFYVTAVVALWGWALALLLYVLELCSSDLLAENYLPGTDWAGQSMLPALRTSKKHAYEIF